jgi:multidrug efflux pump
MTLLALVLAIGLVVDDAIVVVENIYRHIEDGVRPFQAALLGAREIVYPVIAMTITLAAVFTPIGFVSGRTGALFREFAFTLAGAVIVSGVIALTLSPMMCSKLLKSKQEGGDGRLAAWLDRRFESLKQRYQRRLHGTLNYRPVTILVLAGVILGTGLMYMTTQRELAPEEDQGILFTLVKTPQYANLDYLEDATQQLYRIYDAVPEKEHVFTINGMGDVHQGFAGLLLKPWGERERNQKQVLQDLSPGIQGLATAQAISFSPPALPGSVGGPPVQFVITTTHDFRELADVLADVEKSAKESGLFIFSDSDLRFETPQIEFHIDHDKANRLGITMADIGNSLATLLGGNYVNLFDLYGRSYRVVPQVPREFRLDEEWLTRYQVRTRDGTLVPLSNVATVTKTVEPNALTNFQQLNSATLSAVPFPGRTVGEAIDFLKQKAAESFPEGFSYDFQGESRQFVQEGNTLVYTFIFALVIIFLVLAAQYESFRDPLIILVALPTAIFGALIPMNAGLATINIYTQIGLVTLIGLISKHGILMVDFANRLQERGYGRREAIEHAASIRLRPILMTTAAMVVAMVPLLIATGAGAAARFDIGVVIFAGMTIGTLFTLFVTPVVYTYIARDHQKARLALEAEETAGQGLDAKAGAGILFPGEAKPAPSGPDASTGKGRGRLPTAAE